jgi:hypothetical protein
MAANAQDHHDPADHVWNPADVVPVNLSGPTVTAHADQVAVRPSVITIMSAGTYRFTGTLDGRVVVDTDDDGLVRLILDSVEITSTEGSPIEIANADEVLVELPAESVNVLSDFRPDPPQQPDPPKEPEPTTEPLAKKAKPALFSAGDLTIAGQGSLTVNSKKEAGIVSEDGLVLDSGTITVNAGGDGIKGEDYVVVNNGRINVTAGKDGISASNKDNPAMGYVAIAAGTVRVNSGENGVSAATDVIVNGGSLSVKSGGGNTVTRPEDEKHARGVHGDVSVVIGGGRITADSAETAVHSSDFVTIAGGTLTLTASVGSEADGIHGENALNILAGNVTVVNAFEALEALKLTVSGGTVRVKGSNDGLNASEEGVGEFETAPNALIRIDGGTITVEAGDDGFDSNGTITITGGSTVITPAYDGIDANGSLMMAGGTVVINGFPVSDNLQDGLEVLGGTVFTGGTLLSAGGAASYNAPSASSSQGWASFKLDASQPAGTIVHLASGTTVIASYKGARAFQSVLLSAKKITNGEPYDVYVGGTVSGTNIGGMYAAGDITGATKAATITAGRFAR